MSGYNAPVEIIALYELVDAGTFDASTTSIAVGNEAWGKTPKRALISSILGGQVNSIHKESDKYQIASTTIDETFDTAFTNIPINIESIQVYKYVDGYKYNFLLKNLTVSTTKITATIEDVDPSYLFTDFSGIIFEYCLFEKN